MTVPAVSTGQIAVLLDASASMNATDVSDGTRFDEAKQQALSIVDTINPGDSMTVIRVAGSPEVLIPYTDDRAQLRDAISAAQPSDASADWNAALTLAAAGSAGDADFNAVIIGDGGLSSAVNLPAIPGDLRYVPVGRSNDNLAISALATRALPGQPPQLFAQITNYGERRRPRDLRPARRRRVVQGGRAGRPGAQPAARSPISVLPDQFTTLQAGLTLPVSSTYTDYLAEDNRAWTVSTDSGTRRVLLMSAGGNLFLEQVLRSLPGVELTVGDTERGLPATDYDLYVLDGWTPPILPRADLLIVNPPQSTALYTVGATSEQTTNPTVRKEDPRMTFVDFSGVNLLKFKQVRAAWAQPLIAVDGGPLLLAGTTEDRQIAILTFDLRDSDLPLQIQYPILMSALLNWFSPQDVIDQAAANGLTVGDSVAINPAADSDSVRITLPDGSTRTLAYHQKDRRCSFAETTTPGLYTVEVLRGGEVAQTAAFAVNLFDAGESDIAPQPTITLGATTVTQTTEAEIGQREFWSLLAALALLVLLIEWVVYHRRMRAPTVFKPLRSSKART